MSLTFNPGLIFGGVSHQKRSGFAVQWVVGIGVTKQLWQEYFEYVDHIYKIRRDSSARKHQITRVDVRVGARLPNIGDQVWLMTSKQTDPLLQTRKRPAATG